MWTRTLSVEVRLAEGGSWQGVYLPDAPVLCLTGPGQVGSRADTEHLFA
jgi:hypothetical protein